MSEALRQVRRDTAAIREKTLTMHDVLSKSATLGLLDCIHIWRAALKLEGTLKTAIVHLEALDVLSLQESRQILDDALAFEPQMEGSFTLIAQRKPETDALYVLGWHVSPWIKPYVRRLAADAEKWCNALRTKTPVDGRKLLEDFATRLENGMSRAVEAYK